MYLETDKHGRTGYVNANAAGCFTLSTLEDVDQYIKDVVAHLSRVNA